MSSKSRCTNLFRAIVDDGSSREIRCHGFMSGSYSADIDTGSLVLCAPEMAWIGYIH